jgi:hypothetical protein
MNPRRASNAKAAGSAPRPEAPEKRKKAATPKVGPERAGNATPLIPSRDAKHPPDHSPGGRRMVQKEVASARSGTSFETRRPLATLLRTRVVGSEKTPRGSA